ncbi:transcription regulator rrf2-type, partial [Lucifera butyrica]
MNNLHHEIVMLLVQRKTSYANPMNSQQIGAALKVTPSYVRGQLAILVRKKLVEVRRGNGGGYYAGKGCGQKMMMNNMEQPLDKLGCTMEEMLEYLQLLEDGCKKIPAEFYTGKEIQAIESLLQIMEGLHGYQKLIKSAAVLLNIDASAALGEG